MGKVQKEWALLRSHLPHDIFVIVFEDRADLMQCVIKGPRGTPYANGLFFFDIQLPAEYPEVTTKMFRVEGPSDYLEKTSMMFRV
jgi:ubiquitin-conjugating enzyme E2 O